MKRVWFLVLCLTLLLFVEAAASAGTPSAGGERNRIYFLFGGGYASNQARGAVVEAGIEMRLFGAVHARLVMDYYPGDDTERDSEILKHMYGVSLFACYKFQVSESIDLLVKAGGHYTRAKARITALGLTFDTTMADIGPAAGAGFTWQLNNTIHFYIEATGKHLMLDDSWTWFKGTAGVMIRLR